MINVLLALALLQPPPAGGSADTKAWWKLTSILSADSLEGRDTGSPGFDRAAAIVAKRFAAAGLKPLGDDGSWFQAIPFEERRVVQASITIGNEPLSFLYEVTASVPALGAPTGPATRTAPPIEGDLAYRGYCAADALGDVRGKLVICHATRRAGLPSDAQRMAALTKAGAAGVISIADPGFTIEPPRWPFAYLKAVTIAGTPPRPAPALATFTLNAAALGKVIAGSGRSADDLIRLGSAGDSLPSFDLSNRFRATFTVTDRTLRSANVVGYLPGTDPSKAGEAIVLTAHLDGYGYGTPVADDSLYNGTLDDAAYVALLVRLAERRAGKGWRRPVVFVALTGEEKGLHGSTWFLRHLPIPRERIAANINLDQLRPLFPLELLTVHALDETSLGDDAKAIAEAARIRVQNDPEPERSLLRRSDHWNFLQAGIPAVNFVFGFRPGSESEKIYRQWYREGYHTPKDDLDQKIDWKAAGDFNDFYYRLVDRVAGQEAAPAWKPGSKLRPSPTP